MQDPTSFETLAYICVGIMFLFLFFTRGGGREYVFKSFEPHESGGSDGVMTLTCVTHPFIWEELLLKKKPKETEVQYFGSGTVWRLEKNGKRVTEFRERVLNTYWEHWKHRERWKNRGDRRTSEKKQWGDSGNGAVLDMGGRKMEPSEQDGS